MTDTQRRFLRALAERLPIARVAELHLFPPMRQGIVETGIAIVAAVREVTPVLAAGAEDQLAGAACDPTDDASREAPAVDAPEAAAPPVDASPVTPLRERHTVYTARYRLTIKGPERGKWELNVMEEADAPLLTVEMVVRGVQHRAGEGAEPERLEPDALRELLAAPAA